MSKENNNFAERLITWQQQSGRHDLPWQNTKDPYYVWVSEVMLQQTQVSTVIGYYQRFMVAFPTVEALAEASEEAVLAQWAGLGYYSRGRNLHRAAQQVMKDYKGKFPTTAESLMTLPGIGRSTAAAIASFCFGERIAILDGNVKRVLARHAGVAGFPGERAVELRLWEEATARLPSETQGMPAYTQGMMDLGATVCTRRQPECLNCPVNKDCRAFITHRVDELPTPRPRKTIPERALHIVLIVNKDHILLEYRTRPGVWKGLWSLPEADAALEEEALREHIEEWGFQVSQLKSYTSFSHTFSHYRLQLHPWLVKLQDVEGNIKALPKDYAWKALAGLSTLGLPAPIKRFLEERAEVQPKLF